jgi:hypothetical protein
VDLQSRSVVWAAASIWSEQHDAEFVENGRIMLYDNRGSGRGARSLEYDPVMQSFPWSVAEGELGSVFAENRGANQRLSNGNTLIVDPNGGRILEVTRNKELVWQYGSPLDHLEATSIGTHSLITGACRYGEKSLVFLEGTPARP